MSWHVASAANIGAVHGPEGAYQDACDSCEFSTKAGGYFLAVAMSDGAGTASHGGVGATVAVQTLIRLLVRRTHGRRRANALTDKDLREIFLETVEAVSQRASQEGLPISDFSATLVAALIGESDAVFIQVGDGAAVFKGEGTDYEVAIWPAGGEFVNTTFFITAPDARKRLVVRRYKKPIDEVVLFSDGIQHMVLDGATKKPHSPFFERVTRVVRTAECPTDWLESLLKSPQVLSRTDDDTTIFVAVKKESA